MTDGLVFETIQVPRNHEALASGLTSCRLGDTGYAYLQNFLFSDLPEHVTHYVSARYDRSVRVARTTPYANVRNRIYNDYIAHEQACVALIAIRRAISKMVYNDTLDSLTDNGVPVQFFLENMQQQQALHTYRQGSDDLAPHLCRYVPPSSPIEGFIMSWMKDIYIRLMTSASERDRLLPFDLPILHGVDSVTSVLIDHSRDGSEPVTNREARVKDGRVLVSLKSRNGGLWQKAVIEDFMRHAKAYSWNYVKEHKVSQSALSYCRKYLDRHWPARQYGESVTTLYIERFQKEIAYAKIARYIVDTDTHDISEEFEDYTNSLSIAHPKGTPIGLKRDDYDCIRRATRYFAGVATTPEEADEWVKVQKRTRTLAGYKESYTHSSVNILYPMQAYMDPLGFERHYEYRHMAGVMANVFLEQVGMDPDFVFIRCLEAFILSETKRTRFLPQYGRYDRPFLLSVDTIAANRRRERLDKYIIGGSYREYMRFGWFHFVAFQTRRLKAADYDKGELGTDENLSADWIPPRNFRARPARYLGLNRKGYAHYHRLNAPSVCRTVAADVLLRDTLSKHDAKAIEANLCGRINGMFLSPLRRAVRQTKSTRTFPGYVRRAMTSGLRSGDDISRSLTNGEWADYLASGISADTLNDIARKLRGDIIAGYYCLPWKSEERAAGQVETIFSRMVRREFTASLIFDAGYYESFVGKNAGNSGLEWDIGKYTDISIYARQIMRDATVGGDFARESDRKEVLDTDFREMSKRSRKSRMTRAAGKTALSSPSVFAMWRNMSAQYGVSSSNFDLSYITFASRYGMMSRLTSASLLVDDRDQLENRNFRNLISFPVLMDDLCPDFFTLLLTNEESAPHEAGATTSERRRVMGLLAPSVQDSAHPSQEEVEIIEFMRSSRYTIKPVGDVERRIPKIASERRIKRDADNAPVCSMDALTIQYDGHGKVFMTTAREALTEPDFGYASSIGSRVLPHPYSPPSSESKRHYSKNPSDMVWNVGATQNTNAYVAA